MKKALKIIGVTTLVLGALAYLLCYIFLKEQTTYFTECLIDFINKPLPIIGVSLLVVLIFIYKCFISTRYGKKAINEFKEENANLRHEIEKYKELVKQEQESLENAYNKAKQDIEQTKEHLITLCELSHNIKAQALAKKLRGVDNEEETNSDTEAKEI